MRHRPTFTTLTASILCFLFMALASPTQAELPKSVMQDQYMLSLTEALKEKDYQKALPYFEKLEALGLPQSDAFYYFKGETMAKTGKPLVAHEAISEYIKRTGKKGKYYRPALEILVELDAINAAEEVANNEAEMKRKALLSNIQLHFDPLKDMIQVPKGCFLLGSPENEKGRLADEGPQIEMCVESFKISQFEVTQGLWEIIMGNNPSAFQSGNNYPIENVSWNDVQIFIKRMNDATGRSFRLPNEVEWEYATRANTSTPYWWNNDQKKGLFGGGSLISHDDANYGKDRCCDGYSSGLDKWINTAPAGSFNSNAWGLFDTAGNVAEMTSTCFVDYGEGSSMISINLMRSVMEQNCKQRMGRGGSWASSPEQLRSAMRFALEQDEKYPFLGFRLAHD